MWQCEAAAAVVHMHCISSATSAQTMTQNRKICQATTSTISQHMPALTSGSFTEQLHGIAAGRACAGLSLLVIAESHCRLVALTAQQHHWP